jgi:hypothetical protein
MISYFTGTWNSLPAAKTLAEPGERLISKADAARRSEYSYELKA